MTQEYSVTLPKLGESILNATIVQWFKKEGDLVQLDEPLLEVATDKVNSEIPSPVSGRLKTIIAKPDTELQVGDLIAVIALHEHNSNESKPEKTVLLPQETPSSQTGEMRDFFSPALLRLARENGIGLEELQKVPATGSGGRLSKRDLEIYIEKKGKTTSAAPCPLKKEEKMSAEIEHVKMTGMRKAIADNMVRSFYEAPHATLITEIDVTEIVQILKQKKEAFFQKHGAKLTITAFFAKALTQSLREYPLINASLEGDTIVVKRFVNLGIAVSVDQGVMVPVIKNSQAMTVSQIAQSIHDLSTRTRTSKLHPSDVQEGTITLTNFGISGVQIGIPIIRHPEVAILGMGAIHKKVVVFEDDTFGVRSMMHASLTFDHRVLDGMYGCGFLNALKGHLEKGVNIDF